ncbi:MAG: hypothetical protein CBC25_06950 [Pelagibacteraceae bacterium TMED65]|nr:hypothetical protein [Rickettsiales bacterium]OUU51150.1 MAG: hypothetical protein CBC25_06950 [Pelagibacteraceae bacterium TMED65]|tara:strand:+ start:10475 stop:11131 length:657 start_codon:yes stop_codon:yes gene_type:complete
MIKKILKHNAFQLFLGWLISLYIRICFNTSTWIIKNEGVVTKECVREKSLIICFWHSRLLMACFCWNWEKKLKMLVSSHSDGKIISNAISHLGIQTISGSSRKQNISSLKEMIKLMNNNNALGITPDGPKGPNQKLKEGLISLLKKTQTTLVPFSYSAKFKIRLNTWDNFLFVTPFNKFVVVWGNPLKFDKTKSSDQNKIIIEGELNRITRLADNLCK